MADFPDDLNVADDRLTGIAAIAAYRNESPERTKHLIRKGVIPVGYEGDRVVASKHLLRQQHIQQTSSGRRKP